MHFKYKVENKKYYKMYHANINQNKAVVAISLSYEVD